MLSAPRSQLKPLLAAMSTSAKRPWHSPQKAKEDYYTVLGIRRDASQDQIVEAYRRLARECHPDVKPDDPHAEKQFIKVQAAFDVLNDSAKRAEYNAINIFVATTRKRRLSNWRSDDKSLADRELFWFVLVVGLIVLAFSTFVQLAMTLAALGVQVNDEEWWYPPYREIAQFLGGLFGVVSVLTIAVLLLFATGYWITHRK
jgi:hypothetical protein